MRKTVPKYAKFIVTVHESGRLLDSTVHKSVRFAVCPRICQIYGQDCPQIRQIYGNCP